MAGHGLPVRRGLSGSHILVLAARSSWQPVPPGLVWPAGKLPRRSASDPFYFTWCRTATACQDATFLPGRAFVTAAEADLSVSRTRRQNPSLSVILLVPAKPMERPGPCATGCPRLLSWAYTSRSHAQVQQLARPPAARRRLSGPAPRMWKVATPGSGQLISAVISSSWPQHEPPPQLGRRQSFYSSSGEHCPRGLRYRDDPEPGNLP